MQVESGLTIKYSDRIPPLDLSNVCSNTENHFKWDKLNKLTKSTTSQSTRLTKNYNHNNNLNNNNNNNINNKKYDQKSQLGSDGLPIDPRDWTRTDVWKWLINMSLSEGLDVTPDLAQKFPMNGKALCLMSLDMYLNRVPCGGKMLYRDFRVRLAKAMSL